MLGTLGHEGAGNKRMSMWTDEEKRQSLMKTNQDSRVKNRKNVDPYDLNNLDVLLAAEKKLAKKLSLTVEQPVMWETETPEMFDPWTAATKEIHLECGEMFNIKMNAAEYAEEVLDKLQPQLKNDLSEALKKNLEALLTSVKEKAGDGIDITMLDDELQAVIVDDLLLAVTTTLTNQFKGGKIGV